MLNFTQPFPHCCLTPQKRVQNHNKQICQSNLVCWDFEGDGPNPLQVGIATYNNSNITPAFFSDLHFPNTARLNPNNPIAHYLDRQKLNLAPPLSTLWSQLSHYWHFDTFISHAKGTEAKYLGAFPFHPIPGWIDTLKVTRYAYPNLPSHKLGDILTQLNLRDKTLNIAKSFLGANVAEHNPLFDAIGALQILDHILKTPGWEKITIAEAIKLKPKTYYINKKAKHNPLKRKIVTRQMPLF